MGDTLIAGNPAAALSASAASSAGIRGKEQISYKTIDGRPLFQVH